MTSDKEKSFAADDPAAFAPPSRLSAASGAAVRARLKWFNEPKGFGFVVLEDGQTDAFLHITTLQRAGLETVAEGTCLLCHIESGPKGAQVRQITAVLEDADALPPLPDPVEKNGAPHAVLHGTVKWYKPEKGFGFITPDDGQKDVFIHKTCLEQRGLSDIPPGLRVSMAVRSVPKGREVISFEIVAGSADGF